MSSRQQRAAREVVTARYFRDPAPWRAGRTPECEDSRRHAESEQAYRLLGREPPVAGHTYLDLAEARERVERLAPRRYRPLCTTSHPNPEASDA